MAAPRLLAEPPEVPDIQVPDIHDLKARKEVSLISLLMSTFNTVKAVNSSFTSTARSAFSPLLNSLPMKFDVALNLYAKLDLLPKCRLSPLFPGFPAVTL